MVTQAALIGMEAAAVLSHVRTPLSATRLSALDMVAHQVSHSSGHFELLDTQDALERQGMGGRGDLR